MLNSLVKETIHPLLKVEKFKKKSFLWNRENDRFIHVLDIQKSRWSKSETEEFTINLGIFIPHHYELIWGRKVNGFVKEVECTIRVRIGEILSISPSNQPLDTWWVLSKNSLESIKVEVSQTLLENAFPFFNQFSSIYEVHRFLSSQQRKKTFIEQLQDIIVNYDIGEIKKAKEMLCALFEDETIDSGKERIKSVANGLNIQL